MNDEHSSMAANAICHAAHMVQVSLQHAICDYQAPHVIMRPRIFQDGNQWCALYGHSEVEKCIYLWATRLYFLLPMSTLRKNQMTIEELIIELTKISASMHDAEVVLNVYENSSRHYPICEVVRGDNVVIIEAEL